MADAVEALVQSGIPRERLLGKSVINSLFLVPSLGVKCHVQKPEDRQHLVQSAVERFSKIDILVNVLFLKNCKQYVFRLTMPE